MLILQSVYNKILFETRPGFEKLGDQPKGAYLKRRDGSIISGAARLRSLHFSRFKKRSHAPHARGKRERLAHQGG